MIVTVAGFKGGVAKTTTAIHLAAFLAPEGRTALVDGDDNRSATAWAARGAGLGYTVVDVRQTAAARNEYQHLIVDTSARPARSDLAEIARGADLLVLPTTPDALALDALALTVRELRELKAQRFHVLLCAIPPYPSHDGDEARAECLVKDVSRDPRAEIGWNDYKRAAKELYGKVKV